MVTCFRRVNGQGQDPRSWVGVGREEEEVYAYLILQCRQENDLCIKTGSDESDFVTFH